MDFPENDQYWTQTLEAARKCIGPSESVVAHEGFLAFFPKALLYSSVSEESLQGTDWVILHKDDGRKLAPRILQRLKKGFTVVFANEVFLILANKKLSGIAGNAERLAPTYIDPHHIDALFGEKWSLPRRWRVPVTWAFALLIFILAHPGPVLLAVGGIVAFVGLGFRAWSTGYLRKNQQLTTSGPYARVRNPLYLGNFLIGLGFVIASGQFLLGAVCALLFAGSYARLMREEEAVLARMFGRDYWNYRATVPMFLPRFSPAYTHEAQAVKFDPALYWKKGEYRALLGVVAMWAILAFKAWAKH